MRCKQSLGRSAACVMLLALLVGCASAPATPIPSIGPLVCKWAGTVTAERGSQQFFYLTINPDQTLVASWGLNWAWGKVTLKDGRASYEMKPPPREGTIRFYENSGKPTLYLDDLWTEFYAVVTRQE